MTRSSETGSSTTTPALPIASLKPSEPAILKLISEESTGWYLPSKHSTRTSTTGKPCTPPDGHRLLDALLHGGDELAGDGAADDLVDELEAGAAFAGLDAQPRHPELAVAAGLLLVLALGLGRRRRSSPGRARGRPRCRR